MKKTVSKIGLSLTLTSTLFSQGCVNEYRIVDHVNRPAITSESDAVRFYNSIDEKILSKDEATYIEQFRKKSQAEQRKLFHDPLLEQFEFLNRDKPTIRDILFLYGAENEIGFGSHLYRVPGN